MTVVLTAKQIEDLAAFAKEDGEIIPEYTGQIAYSDSLEHGVLQLDD